MPKALFSFRLLFDQDFYEKIIKGNHHTTSSKIMMQLMYVKRLSEQHPKCHNVISRKTFNKILESNPTMSSDILRASFKPLEEPESIEEIENDIERAIKHAIELTSVKPFKTMILTSDEKKVEYENNPHLKDVPLVIVKSGIECTAIIEDYFNKCKRLD